MTDLDLATYKSLYLQTAREHVSDLKKNLELLNQDPLNQQLIYEIFRLFHSLKSQNYFMGFEKTAHLCKVSEKYFHKINSGEKIYQPSLYNIILHAIGKLENSIDTIDKQNNEVDLTQDIMNLETNLG